MISAHHDQLGQGCLSGCPFLGVVEPKTLRRQAVSTHDKGDDDQYCQDG
jgi:hypothetical protein